MIKDRDYRSDRRNALKEPGAKFDNGRAARKALWKTRADNPEPWLWKWKPAVPRPWMTIEQA